MDFEEPYGMLTFEAPKEMNLKVLNFLYDDEELKFRFLTDLCCVHYPEKKEKNWQLFIICITWKIISVSGLKYLQILNNLMFIRLQVYFLLPTGWKGKHMIFMG